MATEKQKAMAGLLYDANHDTELLAERAKCADMVYELNLLQPSKTTERESLIQQLIGRAGENLIIVSPFYCDYGYNIEFGDNCFLNLNCVILDGAKVTFGDNVFIAPNCGFYTAGHPFNVEQRNQGLEYAYPITIGNNVWIGANVSVLPGVRIGDNTVIGAGSIVTKDIPAGVLAVGNPCRVIRSIAEE